MSRFLRHTTLVLINVSALLAAAPNPDDLLRQHTEELISAAKTTSASAERSAILANPPGTSFSSSPSKPSS
jgi:hypothetical protein